MVKMIAVVIIVVGCFWIDIVSAQEGNSGLVDPAYQQTVFQAENLAVEISKVTGCAINPLLGISVIGAYTYYSSDENGRTDLPWYSLPQFWGTLSGLLFLIFLKDSSKILLPKVLSVPLDAAETLIEKNGSALLAMPVLITALKNGELGAIESLSGTITGFVFPVAYAANPAVSLHGASMDPITFALASVSVLVIFSIVWVISQAFNILILLCPFSTIDFMLLVCKNGVLTLLAGLTVLNPYAGLAMSAIIVLVCVFLLPKALRLTLFGTLMSWDILAAWIKKEDSVKELRGNSVKCFTTFSYKNTPSLTYGAVMQHDSVLHFRYKPWLVLPEKIINTDIAVVDCEIEKGYLGSLIVAKTTDEQLAKKLFRFRVAHRKNEENIARILGVPTIRETAIHYGWKAMMAWFRGILPA
ncbi:MAG: hypothetical protein OEM02_06500 [Desulfobulbaceae bacterium]|nr:hypothetical protein [Desulfobulbaceae bacterium]